MDDPSDSQLSTDEAFRAAFYMIDRYLALDPDPSGDLTLLWQYMQSDPARSGDWQESVQRALRDQGWGPDVEPPARGWKDFDRPEQ